MDILLITLSAQQHFANALRFIPVQRKQSIKKATHLQSQSGNRTSRLKRSRQLNLGLTLNRIQTMSITNNLLNILADQTMLT